MEVRTLACATPKGNAPAPKGAPEPSEAAPKSKKDRLPVPPPKGQQGGAAGGGGDPVDDPKKEGIPTFLQIQNRKPLSAEDQKRVDQVMAGNAPKPDKKKAAAEERERKAAEKAKAKTKRAVKKQRKAAKESGAASRLPLSGKDAAKAIKRERRKKPEAAPKKASKKTAAKSRPKVPGRAERAPEVRPGTKLAIVAGLLTSKAGCTAKEVLAATGWPAVSMPQQAKSAGLVLRKEKQGKETRYWGSPADPGAGAQ